MYCACQIVQNTDNDGLLCDNKTGKAIVDAITGEEPEESSAPVSKINAPMSEATAQALLAAIQGMNKIPAFDPADDKGKVLTISNDGEIVWAALPD